MHRSHPLAGSSFGLCLGLSGGATFLACVGLSFLGIWRQSAQICECVRRPSAALNITAGKSRPHTTHFRVSGFRLRI